jgi:hypothetical protein
VLKTIFGAQFAWLLWRHARGPVSFERTLAYSLAGFLAYITLNTGVHENHWFVACLVAMVLASLRQRWIWPAAAVCVLANVNLVLFYGVTGEGPPVSRVIGIDITVPLSLLAVWFYYQVVRMVIQSDREFAAPTG